MVYPALQTNNSITIRIRLSRINQAMRNFWILLSSTSCSTVSFEMRSGYFNLCPAFAQETCSVINHSLCQRQWLYLAVISFAMTGGCCLLFFLHDPLRKTCPCLLFNLQLGRGGRLQTLPSMTFLFESKQIQFPQPLHVHPMLQPPILFTHLFQMLITCRTGEFKIRHIILHAASQKLSKLQFLLTSRLYSCSFYQCFN